MEVEIPFLQSVLKDFEIVPIVTGRIDPKVLADKLLGIIDENTLIVVSSDLSHYYPYDQAVSLDSFCTESIPELDFSTTEERCEACGKTPILTLMHIAATKGWEGKLLDYRNSGDTSGMKKSVVGYAAIAFYEPENTNGLTKYEQKLLLSLARSTLEYYLSNQTIPDINEHLLTDNLKKIQGCFVTLNKHSALRGCIGHMLPQTQLYKCVVQNAVSAAGTLITTSHAIIEE